LYNANKIQDVVVTTDPPNDGDTLIYNNISSEYEVQTSLAVGVNTVQNLTNKSFEDSTTYFYDEVDPTKKLQFQCSEISNGTTRTLTAPNADDTIVVLAANQTLTNKTFTRPILTSESVPIGDRGMVYYDSTLNLPAFFNGVFWQYIGMCIPISVSANIGTFYAVPVLTAIGDLETPDGTTNDEWPTNNWTASNGVDNTLTLISGSITFSTSLRYNYIEYNFGLQKPGMYSLIFNVNSRSGLGILTVTEQTTGIEIFQGDIFRPGSSSPMSYQLEFPFNFEGIGGADSNLTIRWASNTKNSASASYVVRLNGYIQLTRIG
jgi:hypothetical protein